MCITESFHTFFPQFCKCQSLKYMRFLPHLYKAHSSHICCCSYCTNPCNRNILTYIDPDMAFAAVRGFFWSAVVLSTNKNIFLAREDFSPFLKCLLVVASSLSIGLGNPSYDFSLSLHIWHVFVNCEISFCSAIHPPSWIIVAIKITNICDVS